MSWRGQLTREGRAEGRKKHCPLPCTSPLPPHVTRLRNYGSVLPSSSLPPVGQHTPETPCPPPTLHYTLTHAVLSSPSHNTPPLLQQPAASREMHAQRDDGGKRPARGNHTLSRSSHSALAHSVTHTCTPGGSLGCLIL